MGSNEDTMTTAERKASCALVDDWEEQIKMKLRLECEAAEEERMWEYLSCLDMCQKEQIEETYKKELRERAMEAQSELIKQMKDKVEKIEIERRIKAKELALIMQDSQSAKDLELKVAEAKVLERKKNVEHVCSMIQMMQVRDSYREKRTKGEELVGIEFIKQAIKSLLTEQQNKKDQRVENKRAVALYLEYLRKRRMLIKEKESEVEKIIDQVVQEQFDKKMAIRYKDAQQRKLLKESVYEGRAQQCKDREEEKRRQEEADLAEFESDRAAWKQYLKDLKTDKCQNQMKQQQYKADLDAQIAYKRKLKERETNEAVRVVELCTIEDRLFLNKNEGAKRENPYRALIKGKPVQQALIPVPTSYQISYCCQDQNNSTTKENC